MLVIFVKQVARAEMAKKCYIMLMVTPEECSKLLKTHGHLIPAQSLPGTSYVIWCNVDECGILVTSIKGYQAISGPQKALDLLVILCHHYAMPCNKFAYLAIFPIVT